MNMSNSNIVNSSHVLPGSAQQRCGSPGCCRARSCTPSAGRAIFRQSQAYTGDSIRKYYHMANTAQQTDLLCDFVVQRRRCEERHEELRRRRLRKHDALLWRREHADARCVCACIVSSTVVCYGAALLWLLTLIMGSRRSGSAQDHAIV